MPKIIEQPDLIKCEYARSKGWPEIFRRGALICQNCGRSKCQFRSHQPEISKTGARRKTRAREEERKRKAKRTKRSANPILDE